MSEPQTPAPLELRPPRETSPELAALYERLGRWPDVQAPELVAVDAADRLLVDTALAMLADGPQEGAEPPRVVVAGETYGAVSLAMAQETGQRVLVVTDSQVHRNAIFNNAAAAGLAERIEFLDLEDLAGATGRAPVLVLALAPRAHAVLEEWADAAARLPGILGLLVGGRLKHMSLGLNDRLEASFASVQPSRARQKARLIWASSPAPGPERSFVTRSSHDVGLRAPLTLCAVPGAFGADRLDPGTRLLLPVLAEELAAATPPQIVDAGCGNGTIAVFAALVDPEVRVVATDVSRAAIRATELTAEANGVEIRTVLDDALSTWPDASEDFIVLNPPFHAGNTVTEDIALKLFEAAGRVLRPGGTLLTVWNAPLAYSRHLRRHVGTTVTVASNRKFQVTRSLKG
ncbi:class I SAM-dependent methyltransferase [Falsarthrobacter nasiphocae]|uniref:16S rRNA (Guanine1207-N2)-methyltransferase n=1 Tax=Falsarthrobacter nasiphocae TaxID=189863 RepID=A0AAE3YD28_9MICC|nr:methyltransferase [Falsarthrobacter nasiphocae]MDR6891179.1 16S rRNA (guanine1207-N2)-methyltransferase [Falsarthrobacter nasiphocae]